MVWRFHAIDATLYPWSRRLDGVEAHWLISAQVGTGGAGLGCEGWFSCLVVLGPTFLASKRSRICRETSLGLLINLDISPWINPGNASAASFAI